MITLEQLTSYCQIALGQLIDDSEETRQMLLFNVKGWVDRLLAQHIAKNDRLGPEMRRSGAFLSTYLLPVAADDSLPNDRMYFDLPVGIYDLDLDGGIHYVSYSRNLPPNCPPEYARLHFSRTEAGEVQGLYMMKWEAPNPARPYFYRSANRITTPNHLGRVYLPGVDPAITEVEVGLFTTTDPLATIDALAPFEFPDELVPILVRAVVDQGRMSMAVPQERLRNDGRANDLGAPPLGAQVQRNVSVNDPLFSTET